MENSLLSFLEDYVDAPKILFLFELSESEKEKLPESWLRVLENEEEKIPRIIDDWARFKKELKLVYEFLVDNLVSLDLVHFNEEYHLIYGLRTIGSDDMLYYQSSNPKNVEKNQNFKKLPKKLQSFYKLQNGWYYFASSSMGLMPLEETFKLSEYDWEVLESEDFDKSSIILENQLVVFSNGMGGHISIDERMGEHNSLIWWAEDQPDINIEFWPTLDTWIRLGFDE